MTSNRKKPPLLPSAILNRVLRLAGLDGRFLLFASGLFAILSAADGSVVGAVVGCAAAGAGALELHGIGQIRHGNSGGVSWLVRSQLVLLAVILCYVGWCISNLDMTFIRTQLTPVLQTPLFEAALEQNHMTVEEYLRFFSHAVQWCYVGVGVVSVFYQGGMALYYHRRRGAIERALEMQEA